MFPSLFIFPAIDLTFPSLQIAKMHPKSMYFMTDMAFLGRLGYCENSTSGIPSSDMLNRDSCCEPIKYEQSENSPGFTLAVMTYNEDEKEYA